jgi:SAM-dependent methyltransferase
LNTETVNRLIELNRQFYQTFAQPFSATRQQLQPGVGRLLEKIPVDADVLDLGCGNGELWRALLRHGYRGQYLGLDFSAGLLQAARERAASEAGLRRPDFLQVDLDGPDWANAIPNQSVDVITAFAVLHHLPGYETRIHFLHQVRSLLTSKGHLFLSTWQFLNSERLRARIQPWETIGLTAEQVDAEDYLLDWRQGGYGLRYVHAFDQLELATLAQDCGFHILETFYSDGKGGQLSLYQVWEPFEE